MFQPQNPSTADDRILALEAQVKALQSVLDNHLRLIEQLSKNESAVVKTLGEHNDRLVTQLRLIRDLDNRTIGSIVCGPPRRY